MAAKCGARCPFSNNAVVSAFRLSFTEADTSLPSNTNMPQKYLKALKFWIFSLELLQDAPNHQ
jgi:hypothetical protein